MEYEYKEHRITIVRDGEHILTDLEMYQKGHAHDGYEYLDMITLPSHDPTTV